MNDDSKPGLPSEDAIHEELMRAVDPEKQKKYVRFILTAMSSIPWVGGVISATAAMDAAEAQGRVNKLHQQWLEGHRDKIRLLGETVAAIVTKLEEVDAPDDRISSEDYLTLVRQGFVAWDDAATKEKRELVRRLLTNAAATTLCTDDIVRMFIDWIDRYHEIHFGVIRAVYRRPGITRGGIWDQLHGERPREDAPESDLFRLLIRELSTGGVIRQHRETTYYGEFQKKTRSPRSTSGVMKSAFDDDDPYELTALGRWFVHYAMDEAVPRLGEAT